MPKQKTIEERFDERFILPSPMYLQGTNFTVYKKFIKQFITDTIKEIKTDLLKIADEGEYEDLRREVIEYFK